MNMINTLENVIDAYYSITDEEILNDPKTNEIIQELIKDLPPALTKNEIKKLTEEERNAHNRKAYDIMYELMDKNDNDNDDDIHRISFKFKKEKGEPPENYEYMREGAIRSTAINRAINICESRIYRSKEEVKRIKKGRKELEKELIKAINEEGGL